MVGSLGKWLKRKDGTTAVEFALVGGPFIFMILGIIETAMMFAMQSSLEAATTQTARLIRTGQIQQGGGDPQQVFRTALCDTLNSLMSCEELQFQVVSLDDFNDANNLPPASFDEDGNLEDQSFDPGGVNDVVLVRIAYKYHIFTPLFQPVLTNHGDGNRLMLSAIVFQTEPYEFGGDS